MIASTFVVAAASLLAPLAPLRHPVQLGHRPPLALQPGFVARTLTPPLLSAADASADLTPASANAEELAEEEAQLATPLALSVAAVIPFVCLVIIKSATDLITNHVARPPATAMALVSEAAIFPLIAIWLLIGNTMQRLRGGPAAERRDIVGVFRDALTDRPLRLCAIGSVYALDNLFYFFAQSNVGAVTYTVLAQTKIFFTVAVLRMRNMLGEFRVGQKVGLGFLFLGAVLVALRDVATGVAATSGNRVLGIAGLLVAQAATATANVAYERKLREPGVDVWVRNVQLTAMITLWLAVSTGVRTALLVGSGNVLPPPATLLRQFCAPWVWLVVALKAASAVLIALTISAGGNVLYAISKPWPVVVATLLTCIMLGSVPSTGFIAGIVLSVAGITLYYSGVRR